MFAWMSAPNGRVMVICLTLLLLAYTCCAGQGVQIQSLPAPKPFESPSTLRERELSASVLSYYDARERVCASRTFEWGCETVCTYHKESPATEDSIQSIILQENYWIVRTPDLMRVDVFLETPLITDDGLKGKGPPLHSSVFYWGKTGEIVLYAGRDFDRRVTSGQLFQPGVNGLGLPIPFLGMLQGHMVFLAGLSPLRLMGSEPTDWKLLEVNENEWVFERVPDAQARARTDGWLRFDRIEVRLSRKHDDAPARLEIAIGNSIDVWETLEYTRVENTWMPSKVRYETKVGSRQYSSVFRLQNHAKSGNLIVDIPNGTPILDWRARGRGYWTTPLNEIALRVDIPPAVGSGESREAQGYSGVPAQPLTAWGPALERSIRESLQEMERRRRQGAP